MTLLERLRKIKKHTNLDTDIELKTIEGINILDPEYKIYDLLVRDTFDTAGWLLRQEVDYLSYSSNIIICRLKITEQDVRAFLGQFS